MKKYVVAIFALLLFGVCPVSAMAMGSIIAVTDSHTARNITADMLYVSGYAQAEWPWQINEDARWTRYRPSAGGIFNFNNELFTTWYQFRLRNDSGDVQKLFLTLDNHFLKTVDVFVINNSGALERVWRTGSDRGLGTKPYPSSNYAFPINIGNHDRKHIYMRVVSSINAQLSVSVMSDVKFGRLDTLEKISGGLILGITCLVFLYTLMLFIFLRDRKYFYYSVFTLSISMCLWLTGCYLTLFPSILGGFEVFKLYLFFNFVMLWGLLFSCSGYFIFNKARLGVFHVSGNKKNNRFYRALRTMGSVFFSNWSSPLGVAVGVMSGLIMSAAVLNWFLPAHVSFLLLDVFLSLMLLWGVFFLLVSLRQRNFVHLGYSTAIILFLVGSIIPGLRLMGVIHSESWARASFFVVAGAVALVVVISLIYGTYTERHKKLVANNVSKARKRRFDEVYKYASEGMFTINVDGVFKQVNPAFCRMLGCRDFRELVTNGTLRFHDVCENPHDFEDLVSRLVSMHSRSKDVELAENGGYIVDGEIKLHTKGDKVLLCGLRIRISNNYDPLIFGTQKTDAVVIEGEITDLSANHGYQEMLDYVKTHDELTSLYNRSFMMTKLKTILESTPEKESHATKQEAVFGCNYLCFISLNNLKFIYDVLGHKDGDEFVRKVASYLKENSLESFCVIKLNGSEFAVIMTDSYVDQTLDYAEKLRQGLSNMRYESEGRIFGVSVNIGVVDMAYANGELSRLLTLADLTCEKSKSMGQNTMLFYNQEVVTATDCREDVKYSTILYRALDNGLIGAARQEILAMDKTRSNLWMGELYVRIRDEHGNVYEPHEFVDFENCNNIMPKIDEWMIQRLISTWTTGGSGLDLRRALIVFVNISEGTVCDLVLWGKLQAMLNPYKELCDRLCFEVPEACMSSHPENLINFVKRFRKLGIRFALDACGESRANTYQAVLNVHPDYLKISRNITTDITTNSDNSVVVKSMVMLAHDLGIKTVAINIENSEQFAKYQSLGVDYCQGFYVSSVERVSLASVPSANDGVLKKQALS